MKDVRKSAWLLLLLLSFGQVRADEGMWPVSRLSSPLMQKMGGIGLQLPAEKIYSETDPSLKDAVMVFDNAGTAEFVSAKGLIFTNHHCGRGRVQQVSTDAHNYLRDGYWATAQTEEIPIKGLTVRTLQKIVDVTDQATNLLKTKGIRKVSAELERQYNDTVKGLQASLDGYSDGTYFISVYQVFKDVRLVGVPPESIGNFGGETDNFEWPRHSGDFSIFRVYANANNLPADYSKNNKPYQPKAFLPISLAGVHDHDFAMTLGFPFMTQRHITSFELQEELDKNRATAIAKGRYIDALGKEMDKDERIRLIYSDKNFSAGNVYKFSLGTYKQVNLSPVMESKRQDEAAYMAWVNADTARIKKYGNCLAVLEKNFALEKEPKFAHTLVSGALFNDASLFGIRSRGLVEALEHNNQNEVEREKVSLGKWYANFSKEYDSRTDQAVLCQMIKLLKNNLKKEYLPDFYTIIDTKYNGDIDKYVDDLYAKSIFSTPAGIEKFIKKPTLKIKQDPLYVYGVSVYNKLIDLKQAFSDYEAVIRSTKKVYNEGVREMEKDRLTYPDANFSMRLTYGTVAGANPRDGIYYKSQSTLKGVIEKEDSSNYEFVVSPKLKELYLKKEYGRYGENDEMNIDFLTSTDITGGNSGSPVVNGKGEMTGVAFDGNWESLAGSMVYEPDKNRSVNVDIRYALFVIDKYAHSSYVLNELTIR
ncbi:MAG: S46 family peptidase [Bacteroidota bacterium]|nr:S46 family peptidase [Bacteroidota bacterium]